MVYELAAPVFRWHSCHPLGCSHHTLMKKKKGRNTIVKINV